MNQSLRPKKTAEYLGISLATLWRWAAQRKDFPKARKLSTRCTIFDVAEVKAWRDAHVKGEAQ